MGLFLRTSPCVWVFRLNFPSNILTTLWTTKKFLPCVTLSLSWWFQVPGQLLLPLPPRFVSGLPYSPSSVSDSTSALSQQQQQPLLVFQAAPPVFLFHLWRLCFLLDQAGAPLLFRWNLTHTQEHEGNLGTTRLYKRFRLVYTHLLQCPSAEIKILAENSRSTSLQRVFYAIF